MKKSLTDYLYTMASTHDVSRRMCLLNAIERWMHHPSIIVFIPYMADLNNFITESILQNIELMDLNYV